MKIGGGCATVTDYKLPLATVQREGGSEAKSEVRIPAWLYSSWSLRQGRGAAAFGQRSALTLPTMTELLRQEKDEASRSASAVRIRRMPSFSVLPGVKVFCFQLKPFAPPTRRKALAAN